MSTTRSDVPCAIEQRARDRLRIMVGGEEYLAAATCPHRRGRLAYGVVNVRRVAIICPLHASTFDLRTGRRMAGPATEDLRVGPLSDDAPCPELRMAAGASDEDEP